MPFVPHTKRDEQEMLAAMIRLIPSLRVRVLAAGTRVIGRLIGVIFRRLRSFMGPL